MDELATSPQSSSDHDDDEPSSDTLLVAQPSEIEQNSQSVEVGHHQNQPVEEQQSPGDVQPPTEDTSIDLTTLPEDDTSHSVIRSKSENKLKRKHNSTSSTLQGKASFTVKPQPGTSTATESSETATPPPAKKARGGIAQNIIPGQENVLKYQIYQVTEPKEIDCVLGNIQAVFYGLHTFRRVVESLASDNSSYEKILLEDQTTFLTLLYSLGFCIEGPQCKYYFKPKSNEPVKFAKSEHFRMPKVIATTMHNNLGAFVSQLNNNITALSGSQLYMHTFGTATLQVLNLFRKKKQAKKAKQAEQAKQANSDSDSDSDLDPDEVYDRVPYVNLWIVMQSRFRVYERLIYAIQGALEAILEQISFLSETEQAKLHFEQLQEFSALFFVLFTRMVRKKPFPDFEVQIKDFKIIETMMYHYFSSMVHLPTLQEDSKCFKSEVFNTFVQQPAVKGRRTLPEGESWTGNCLPITIDTPCEKYSKEVLTRGTPRKNPAFREFLKARYDQNERKSRAVFLTRVETNAKKGQKKTRLEVNSEGMLVPFFTGEKQPCYQECKISGQSIIQIFAELFDKGPLLETFIPHTPISATRANELDRQKLRTQLGNLRKYVSDGKDQLTPAFQESPPEEFSDIYGSVATKINVKIPKKSPSSPPRSRKAGNRKNASCTVSVPPPLPPVDKFVEKAQEKFPPGTLGALVQTNDNNTTGNTGDVINNLADTGADILTSLYNEEQSQIAQLKNKMTDLTTELHATVAEIQTKTQKLHLLQTRSVLASIRKLAGNTPSAPPSSHADSVGETIFPNQVEKP